MKSSNYIKLAILSFSILSSPLIYSGTLTPADASIVSDINRKYIEDKTTSDLKIRVTSHDGVVTLTGNVNTDTEADKLIQLAESTKNVKDVKTSNLNVKKSKYKMSDTAITAKIKGLYLREKIFGDKDISVMGVNVVTTNGIVYLTGVVDNQEESDNAVKYAKSINGVKRVESKLEVKQNN